MASEADVRGLREKYTRMRTLRVLHEQKKQDPSFEEPDPRNEMASLAEEFPGALREIDVLPLEVIEDRIKELTLCEKDPERARAAWMVAQTLFHRVARGALKTKRWLGKRKTITTEIRERFTSELVNRNSDLSDFTDDDLPAIANPPNGRVMEIVHAKVALMAGITTAESKRLVFSLDLIRRTRKK
jgi:hypothetical protein